MIKKKRDPVGPLLLIQDQLVLNIPDRFFGLQRNRDRILSRFEDGEDKFLVQISDLVIADRETDTLNGLGVLVQLQPQRALDQCAIRHPCAGINAATCIYRVALFQYRPLRVIILAPAALNKGFHAFADLIMDVSLDFVYHLQIDGTTIRAKMKHGHDVLLYW